jgi:hypothetical protein
MCPLCSHLFPASPRHSELRPPIAQDKIEQGPDGLVRIVLKKPYADGTVAVDL